MLTGVDNVNNKAYSNHMLKRYTAAEIEIARDYIGHHADALPRMPEAPTAVARKAARMAARAATVAKSNERARAAGIV